MHVYGRFGENLKGNIKFEFDEEKKSDLIEKKTDFITEIFYCKKRIKKKCRRTSLAILTTIARTVF